MGKPTLLERLGRVTDCLVSAGADYQANVDQITSLCGDLLDGTCALYNRLEEGTLCTRSSWRPPPDLPERARPDGHICFDLITSGDRELLVRDLPSTGYWASDPRVARHGLQTYLGASIRCGGKSAGALCVVYTHDFNPSEDDLAVLRILAAALATEERRHAAITARVAEQTSLSALLSNMGEGFALHELVVDGSGEPADYRFLEVNPAFEHLTGHDARGVVGRTVSEVLPGMELEFLARFGRVMLGGESVSFETRAKTLDRDFVVHAYRPAPMQFACTFADVTERNRAERERQALQQLAMESQKLETIGMLAGSVAHDFNNLLGALLGELSLLEMELTDRPELHSDVVEMKSLVRRGNELSRQLFGFSGRAKYDPRPLDPDAVVGKIVGAFRRSRKNLAVKVAGCAAPTSVRADHAQLEQLTLNLCLNAGQAMPAGGTLRLASRTTMLSAPDAEEQGVAPGSYYVLSATYPGGHLDASAPARIFEPNLSEQDLSNELRLAAVQTIARNHGGFAVAESACDGATTLSVLLPLVPTDEPNPDRGPLWSGAGTILVVDDEASMLHATDRLLRRLGHDVLTAGSGSEAVQRMEQHRARIVLVIVDMVMPGMGGRETFEALRAIDPSVRVLLVSGHSVQGEVEELLSQGCLGFLRKPFDLNDLSEQIRGILGRK